ncbi:hypothetical protein D3C72_1217150 [compost metagenome]
MRHVDDAHQAEGNGQAQRGQQQHAAQADAVKEVTRPFDGGQMAVDLLERRGRRVAHGRIGLRVDAVALLRQRGQHGAEGGVACFAQYLHGMQTLGGVGAFQFQVGLRDQQRIAHGLILFSGQCLFKHGQARRVARLLQAARGIQAFVRLVREQARSRQRGLDGAAQAVVDADGAGTRRQIHGRARRRIGGARAVDADQHAAIGRCIELVIAQRLQDRRRERVRVLAQRGNRLQLGVGVVAGQRRKQGRVHARRRRGRGQQRHGKQPRKNGTTQEMGDCRDVHASSA